MISRKDIERIAALSSDEGVLSVYIKLDPRLAYDRGQALSKFKGACKRHERSMGEAWKDSFARERAIVEAHIATMELKGQSVVIFSCKPAGIWEEHVLEFMLPTFVTVDRTTHTSLLTQALDEWPRTCAVLLDGENARVYFIEQARSTAAAEIESAIPNRHKQGGWAQARFQRHIDFHGALHLRQVADRIAQLYYEEPFDRLAVVGVQDVTSEFMKLLARPVAEHVIGSLTADFKQESDEQIMDRVRELRAEDARRREEEEVRTATGAADAGGRGSVGMADTVAAILAGRVDTLLIADGLSAGGSACSECGFLSESAPNGCPVCGAVLEDVPDLVERAVDEVLIKGGHIDTVFGQARDWLVARGGIAAILRY